MNPTHLHRCKDCGRDHEIFVRIGKGGDRSLNYICDRQRRYWLEGLNGKDVEHFETVTKVMHLEYREIPGLREELTPGAKADLAKKSQLQLVMPTTRRNK